MSGGFYYEFLAVLNSDRLLMFCSSNMHITLI